MERERRTVTVTWRGAQEAGINRLTLPLRWLQIGAGVLFFGVLGTVVLGAVALRLQQETGALHARCAVLGQERVRLATRAHRAEQEIEQAQEGLARVRTEEAKIRSWLGLESAGEGTVPVDVSAGGKGSLGDEDLGAVAPEARSIEAEVADPRETGGIAAESRALAADLADLAVFVQKQKQGWDAIPAISPVDGEHWISSPFGWRSSPFTGKREFHNGLDMAGRKGTPVVASANGVVYRVFNDAALGKGLSIDHGNGIRTIYGHMDRVVVKQGEKVSRGQQVGEMGSTGKRSTGPHVHYALKVDGKYVNPRNYLLDRTRPSTAVARR